LQDYQKASFSFRKAVPSLSKSGSLADLLVAYEGLIKASNGLNDFKQSVGYYETYLSIKDTLNSKELNTALDSLKVKFNTEQTLRENTLLSKDNQTQAKIISLQRTIMVSAFVFAALLLSLVVIVVRSRRKLSRANGLLVSKNEEISAASEEIRLKNDQLTEFSKYKDSMNSFLVHDLKNPLNSIIHFDPDNFTNQQAEGVRQSGLQMLNIVSNLLDISKHSNCKMRLTQQDTSLAQLIHEAFRETDFLARQKSIHMVMESRSDYILNADAGIIKRVVINIFTNAIKFSAQGGRIRIMPEQTSPDMVKISITDEGDGIAPDYLPFVFNQFTQGIPRKSGFSASTGIGLAFCKMAVEAHGGEIGVISSPGNGATFWFSLPLSKVNNQISEQQVLELPENLTPVLKVSPEDKEYLEVFCKNFENVSVYQFTEAKEILKTLEERSPGLSRWKSMLLEALTECNEVKYKDLIRVGYDE